MTDSKYIAFKAFMVIPKLICITPKITANFILKEFTNVKSLLAIDQIGSFPI